jgi:arginase
VHFDAHPDLYDEFEGDRLSHASPFARIMEEKLAARLVQVGIRTLNAPQRAQIARFGVELVEMKDFRPDLLIRAAGPVYVSVDLDGLDPAYAPGVSHPEPGGLSTRDVLGVLQRLEGQLIGADVVELNPQRDPDGTTARVAAKITKELVARMLAD